jgi:hypothetical protein
VAVAAGEALLGDSFKKGGLVAQVAFKLEADPMTIKCPCCQSSIPFKLRLRLISERYISCPDCKAKLTTSILSSVLVAIAVGGPTYAAVKLALENFTQSDALIFVIPVLALVAVLQLLSPLKHLVEVN